jgi:hypothetical protein
MMKKDALAATIQITSPADISPLTCEIEVSSSPCHPEAQLLLDEDVSLYFWVGAALSGLAVAEALYLLDLLKDLVDPFQDISLCRL